MTEQELLKLEIDHGFLIPGYCKENSEMFESFLELMSNTTEKEKTFRTLINLLYDTYSVGYTDGFDDGCSE